MPNGTAETNPAFQPCNQVVGTISMCCGTNWTGGVVGTDTCETNGLCLNNNPVGNVPLYWRGSCTDPTWKSPYCLRGLCTTNVDMRPGEYGNAVVVQCDDGSWCCDTNHTACCQQKKGTVLAATIGVTASSSSTLAATSSFSSGSASTTAPVVSATPTSLPSDGLTLAAKIGLGVGLGLGGVLVAVAITWLVLWIRRYRKTATTASEIRHPELYDTQRDRNELDGSTRKAEMADRYGPSHWQYEVDGGGLGRGRWELPG